MSAKSLRNQKLCKLYQPVKLLGWTSTTTVFEVADDQGRRYAAKVAPMNGPDSRNAFLTEFRLYSKLTQGRFLYNMKSDGTTPHGFVNLHYAGPHNNAYDVLVMDLLSPNLFTLRNELAWQVKFTYDTYLTLGRDMLFAIMALHQHGYIHRNVKPHNFRLEEGFNPCLLNLTTAKRYIDPKTNHHYQQCEEQSFIGTLEYASLNAHVLKSQSRRDDLISLGYSIVDMMKKGLPWGRQHTEGRSLTYRSCFTRFTKENTRIEVLCAGLPIGVFRYMQIVTTLAFDALPDYFLLHTLLDSRSQEHISAVVGNSAVQ